MAKYRWGFETIENGNPIFTECFPIVEDGTSLDYAQQTNEVFYRAKLNGTITFRFDTFDYIIDAGYNAEHIVVLQRYDENESDFVEVWRGKFTLTDCTINYDTHTIEVTPETIDRYTAVLDNMEKEYNLVKLKARMSPVNILIRPCLQIYKYGSSKIANFIGGNSWDSECDAPTSVDDLTDTFKFEELRDCIWFTGVVKSGPNVGKSAVYYGRFLFVGSAMVVPMDGRIYNSDGTYIEEEEAYDCAITHDSGHKWLFSIVAHGTSTLAIAAMYDDRSGGDNTESYAEGNIFEDTYLVWDRVFGRTICNTTADDVTIGGSTYSLYAIAANDMAGINLNYNKVMQKAFASIEPSIDTDIEPTTWPQDTHDRYFVKPANTPTTHYWAASPETWLDVAYWWWAAAQEAEVEEKLTAKRKINDCYDYRSVIGRLLNKAGILPQYIISFCLGGTNDYVGSRTDLRITPRSNVISSYYDTPAQNAPISLSKILNMLKAVYQCYWYIDNNGNFHIEHISFFDNGYTTTEDEPELIVDLESELHTRTLNNKVYGQNQVKFDKQDMPEQYSFGWADAVTRPFVGYPINCLDNYVLKGNISEQNAADYDSDVDYVLSSPNDVSKDGFFLFALPAEGLDYSDTLKVENVTIKDENGESYEVSIQNADAAFVKIHETWWRYHLPCENINVNNEDTVALTTGSYKLQSLEFADTAMADIIGNVDNCNKIIRTQQGDGHVKTLSINLNSLATKADLLFNFVGRWYYLRGTALGASITINVNGESVTIDVSNNTFKYRYKEPIAALDFSGTDVVSVNFADCDSLNNLTSADDMFKNCAELLAVDFANKTFGAVTTANDMFAGCSELTTLICPPTESWKADLDFSDCPNLTLESLNDLINDFLYSFDSGIHTITPNSTMWNALEGAVQDDIIARATAKGWTIAIPAQYSVTGTSAGSVVYATINGTAVEIAVSGGSWSYDYNTPISSIAFTNDTNLQTVDFSLSDGLASLTSLDNTFKGCSSLTAVDFTNCDLTNVASAADCFAGCSALSNLTIPANSWKPDIDFSDSALIAYAEMQDIINSLYTYGTGTHTITFNSTYWDSLTQPQQQTISDAAQLKGWTTNAVMVIYKIKGKSTAASETFTITFINLQTQATFAETITVNVDGNGDWEYQYDGKKIYSLANAFATKQTITAIEIDENFSECVNISGAFNDMRALATIKLTNATFENTLNGDSAFAFLANNNVLTSLDITNATFDSLTSAYTMFGGINHLSELKVNAIFANVTDVRRMFLDSANINLPNATFASATTAMDMFNNTSGYISAPNMILGLATDCSFMFLNTKVTSININSATFASATTIRQFINIAPNLAELNMPNATFANVTTAFAAFAQYNNVLLHTINMPNATFESLSTSGGGNNMFGANLTRTVRNLSVAANKLKVTMDLSGPNLTYQSILNVANWCADLTGLTAQTIKFYSVAWNALSSAEQNTIDTILSGKNWTRAIA